MSILESIELLKAYKGPLGLTLHKGASEALIQKVESIYGITLPADFKTLYRFTDGFHTVEDDFNMIPLAEIIDSKSWNNRKNKDHFYVAEYMIYCDMWALDINPNDCDDYKIFIGSNDDKLVLTQFLAEFIDRFLDGGVFEIGGLYTWADEIKAKLYGNTDPVTIKPLLWVYRECLKRGLMTKQHVVDRADWIIATEEAYDPFFMEMSLSHDVDELITVLDSINLTDDILALRAFFGVIYTELLIDRIEPDNVLSILGDFSTDEGLTVYERNKIRALLNDHDYSSAKMFKQKLKQQLRENLKAFLNNYSLFNIYGHKNWEQYSTYLKKKFESMDGE